jgi:osmoprotectant transport system substrate-binding protein
MRKNWKGAAAVFAAVATLAILIGCSTGTTPTPSSTTAPATPKGTIVVGSKIDTEGKLLGAIIIAKLKDAGFTMEDKTQTGATDVVRKALTNGEIDIYPEYTGSGFWFYNDSLTDQQKADFKDGEKGYALVKQLDAEKANVTWLEPARANNTWALAVTKDFAAANNLKTMSDLGAYVNSGKEIKVAASDEFFNNADAWPAFKDTYGFDIPKNSRIILSGGDTAQTEKAVADGTNGVNVGMAYGTDGALSELGLVVLEDDKGAQLVYWPTPIARSEIASKYPEIATDLKPVFDALTLEKLQELNGRIQANGESAQAVAEDFLKSGGFIK